MPRHSDTDFETDPRARDRWGRFLPASENEDATNPDDEPVDDEDSFDEDDDDEPSDDDW